MKKAKAMKAAKAEAREEKGELPALHREEGPHDHEISSAADTLMRAEDIKKDEKLMPHVQKHLSKKMHSLKQLKKLAGEKAMEESEG